MLAVLRGWAMVASARFAPRLINAIRGRQVPRGRRSNVSDPDVTTKAEKFYSTGRSRLLRFPACLLPRGVANVPFGRCKPLILLFGATLRRQRSQVRILSGAPLSAGPFWIHGLRF